MKPVGPAVIALVVLVTACANESDDGLPDADDRERAEVAEPDETPTTRAATTTTESTTTTTESTTTTTESTTTTVATTTTTEAPAAPGGSRDDPVPAGIPVAIGDWEVTLAPTNRNATDAVLAENEFNEPPAAGRTFVMTEATVTYVGQESGTPWLDLTFDFVDAAGNTAGTSAEASCGLVPNDLINVGEMFTGASASGNVCVSAPADQIEGGVWFVEDPFTFADSRVYFALD